MGRFVIARDRKGVHFVLLSKTERVLVTSKTYANLDTCKKAICSLVYHAPIAPLVDLTAGERDCNPKFELCGGEGAYTFALKSPNGKRVVECGPFETRKAALRALTMLRQGVLHAEVVLATPERATPLTVKNLLK